MNMTPRERTAYSAGRLAGMRACYMRRARLDRSMAHFWVTQARMTNKTLLALLRIYP
jgi:hypothetical protein